MGKGGMFEAELQGLDIAPAGEDDLAACAALMSANAAGARVGQEAGDLAPYLVAFRRMVAGGATVLQVPSESGTGGNHHAFPPTVVLNAPADSKLMTEEIFGPVLPVLGHDGLEEAARFINERDRPLALYVYTKSKATAQNFLDKTMSGGVGVNVPMLHLSVEDLPFGGTGASGYGAYHGEEGFRTFCHERSVFHAPVWHPIRLMAPPYGKLFEFFKKLQAG
mgnify:CR=1 FL=1